MAALGHGGGSNFTATEQTNSNKVSFKTALYALFVLFFMMGFITCLNDILVPYLKKVFNLNYTQASLVQFCFFTAYAVMSIPSSKIIEKLGYKSGMIIGFVTAAVGCLMFFPAVSLHSYPIFLVSLFILASGIVLLQVAGNPYVAILGNPETSSARLTLAQALNSVGTFLAPFFGSYFILSALSHSSAEAVRIPYLGLAAVLLLIAFLMYKFKLPVISAEDSDDEVKLDDSKHSSAWSYSHLVFGAIGIFAYVGGEVSIGSYLINYLEMPEIAGLDHETGAKYVAFYWGGAMVGRFMGAVLLEKFKPNLILAFNALASIALIFISINTSGAVAMYTIIGVGFFNSIMFPTIFTLAVKGLGRHTTQGSGILSTAIVGGAIIPLVMGTFADTPSIGLRLAFLLPAVCYLYIAWFGFSGYKKKN
jgi:MFS transporter, FHS family, L-fucose permease